MAQSLAKVDIFTEVEAPDFYWKFRLNRLANKMESNLKFDAINYPHISGYKDLYDTYLLDLALQDKLTDLNREEENRVNEKEWLTIYNEICQWSKETAKNYHANKPALPANDLDVLKLYFPNFQAKELEDPFDVDIVGPDFPYKNMIEMFQAAGEGTFAAPGFTPDPTDVNLSGDEARAELAALKERTMTRLDAILAESIALAKNPYPDEAARVHYQNLRKKLQNFPQTRSERETYHNNMIAEVDEMARMASKKAPPVEHDEHHGHAEGAHTAAVPSPAMEFEAKYGWNLDQLQQSFTKFKSDPVGYSESVIAEKLGSKGLSAWKQSQKFSEQIAMMNTDEKAAAEETMKNIINGA